MNVDGCFFLQLFQEQGDGSSFCALSSTSFSSDFRRVKALNSTILINAIFKYFRDGGGWWKLFKCTFELCKSRWVKFALKSDDDLRNSSIF